MHDDDEMGEFSPNTAVDHFCTAAGHVSGIDEDGAISFPIVSFHLHNDAGGKTEHVMRVEQLAEFVASLAITAKISVEMFGKPPTEEKAWYRNTRWWDRVFPLILLAALIAVVTVADIFEDGVFAGLVNGMLFGFELVGLIVLVIGFRRWLDQRLRVKAMAKAQRQAASKVDGSHEAI